MTRKKLGSKKLMIHKAGKNYIFSMEEGKIALENSTVFSEIAWNDLHRILSKIVQEVQKLQICEAARLSVRITAMASQGKPTEEEVAEIKRILDRAEAKRVE